MPIEAPGAVRGGRKVKTPMLRVGLRRLLSAVIALTFCVSAVFGLLVASSSDSADTVYREGPAGNDTIPVRALALTVHDPIFIDGNAEFTNASGVVWGSGTESDPYIIEGWDIDASTANGIEIDNTDAHFIVRTCHVHDGGMSGHGIVLLRCANGTLDSNNCSNNSYGIGVFSSSENNNISNNNCSNDIDGLCVWSSDNNTVSNNNCPNNYMYGICVYLSSGNDLRNNSCSNNSDGIYIYSSSGCALSNNNCSNNGDGIWLDASSSNTINNNTCSSNTWPGIRFDGSSGNTISNNNCSNNGEGIRLDASSSNAIRNNTCLFSYDYGISIISASDNRIWNNTLCYNNGAGDAYDPTHVQAYDNGTNNQWNTSGSPHGYGNYWSDWTGPDDDTNGIVDLPYNITGSVKDYYPLTITPTEPIPELSMMPFVVMVLLAAIVLTIGARRRKAQ